MAQQTSLSLAGLPGIPHSFSAKNAMMRLTTRRSLSINVPTNELAAGTALRVRATRKTGAVTVYTELNTQRWSIRERQG